MASPVRMFINCVEGLVHWVYVCSLLHLLEGRSQGDQALDLLRRILDFFTHYRVFMLVYTCYSVGREVTSFVPSQNSSLHIAIPSEASTRLILKRGCLPLERRANMD